MPKFITAAILTIFVLLGYTFGAGSLDINKTVKSEKSETAVVTQPQTIQSDNSQKIASPVTDATTGEEINWQVISSGGLIGGTSANYILSGTLGQTAVGSGSSANYALSHGFWQDFFTSGDCCVHPGDANSDGSTNIVDASFIINWIFFGGADPECPSAANANADTGVNIVDASYIINWIFFGGPDPICGPVA